MRSIFLPYPIANRDLLEGDLWDLGTKGVVEEDGGLRAFFEDAVELAEFACRYGGVQVRDETDTDGKNFATENWDPILIGTRFFVAPPWVTEETPPGRLRLTLDSSLAFGTGRHESTQLMLGGLETLFTPGMTVADIGCGSGILSRAAALLGAPVVIACDVDPLAARTTAQGGIPAFTGSADALRSDRFDVVLANVTPRLIDTLGFELQRITKPDGHILLGGFLDGECPSAFVPLQTSELNGWQCWVCSRESYIGRSTPTNGVHSEQWW